MFLKHQRAFRRVAQSFRCAFASAELDVVVDLNSIEHDGSAGVFNRFAARIHTGGAKIDVYDLPLISWLERGCCWTEGFLQVFERATELQIVALSLAVLDA